MESARPDLRLWVIGLAVFLILLGMVWAIAQASNYGIVDHQVAATAARVNEIQSAWRADGVRTLVIVSMFTDLLFIGAYGWGSWRAGISVIKLGSKPVRIIGRIICVAALAFLFTDYLETILQLLQMVPDQGIGWMAAAAAAMQAPKVGAFVVTFVGVLLALIVHRFAAPSPS